MEISVIVPVYNGEKYLKRCADSILAQSLPDFEVIFINDGSCDNSRVICEEYAQSDKRVKLINKDKSEGAGPARNSGLDTASGKYIMFLDADDYIEPDMFETLVKAQCEQDSDLVICSYLSFVEGVDGYNEASNYTDEYFDTPERARRFFADNFPDGKVGYLWNKLYKADIIKENSLRFPDMRRLQDGVFNIGYFSCISSCRVISRPLYHYMLNPQTGLFKKCPPDYFELIRRFSTDFLDTVDEWGYNTKQCSRNISVFFLNELGNCLENANCKNWNMDKTARNAYYEKLRRDDFVKQNIENRAVLGRYRRLLLSLLSSGHFGLLSAVINLKIGIKKNFKNLFYALKGSQNK